MTIHKDTRKLFTAGNRIYEAVGFLNEGETSVDGDTMLFLTAGENGGAIGEEDEVFLFEECYAPFPVGLRQYCLVTNRRDPGNPRFVSYFGWSDVSGRWSRYWGRLDFRWDGYCLVVRRRA